MMTRRTDTGLHNWRINPHSRWAFQNVREIIPTAQISASDTTPELKTDWVNFAALNFDCPNGQVSLPALAEFSDSDVIVVLHQGKLIYQWQAPYCDFLKPHIIFSISKSLTAIVAGMLTDQGILDCHLPVGYYLPGTRSCAYGDSTVQQVLDMTVSLDFEENYSDPQSEYMRYREATAWNPVDQNQPGPDLETFLYSLSKDRHSHGEVFAYRSPNTDLLGLLLERVTEVPLAQLYSDLLWHPLGMQTCGYVTLDRSGLARAAGGICLTALDLARVGQLFLDRGYAQGRQVVSENWIEDTCNNGSQSAWDKGNYKEKMPDGKYRNKWYQSGDADRTICARGIHGQLLYINPAREVVVARLSSHPDPLNDVTTVAMLQAFEKLAKEIG